MAQGSKQRAKYTGFHLNYRRFCNHWRKNTLSKLGVILNLKMDCAATWYRGPVLPLADKNAPHSNPQRMTWVPAPSPDSESPDCDQTTPSGCCPRRQHKRLILRVTFSAMTSTAAVAVTVAAWPQLHLPSTPSCLLDMSVAPAHTPIEEQTEWKTQEWVFEHGLN